MTRVLIGVDGSVLAARAAQRAVILVGGVALAFSDKDSASIAYTMAISPQSQTRAPGGAWASVPGSQTTASVLNFGLNHVVNKHLTINGAVAVGLTPDAPNFVVGVRFPYTF